MRKIAIINNFGMFPSNPPNSTSKVCSLLKRETNINVKHIDLNLLIWKKILSKDFLNKCEIHEERLTHSNVSFCEKMTKKTFSAIKSNVLENIEEAIKVFKDKKLFADTNTLSWAVNIVTQAQQIIYNTYGTLIHNKMIFWPEIGSDTNDLDKVFKYSMDKEHNPLIDLMESTIMQYLIEWNPEVVGIDIVFPWEIVQVVTLNKLIKKHLPNTHINFLGYGFDEFCYSRVADKLIINEKLMLEFDSIFLVRNDNSLSELYKNPNVDLSSLESLAYYTEDKKIEVKGPLYENVIDHSIIPDYSDLNLEEYFSPELVFTDKLSNKCFWSKCTFCNINKFKSQRYELNIESYLNVVKHYIEKYNCENLFLLDEAASPMLVEKFSKGLIKNEIHIHWSIRTRIDSGFDERLISLMYEAGCREMWIGFEAASPRILKNMNKTNNPNEYVNIANNEMKWCKKYGIGLHFCLILGFPNELELDREELKKFFISTEEHISKVPFFVTFNCFNLNSETYIYDHYKEFGIERIDYNVNSFNMINIPFIREDTGKSQSEMELALEPFCDELVDIFVKNVSNKLLWFTIADSCWEMLFKKYNSNGNPFQEKPNVVTRAIIKLYLHLSKNSFLLKMFNKFLNNKVINSKSTLYH